MSNKKQEQVSYLLEVKGFLERERGKWMNYTEFSDVSKIPFKTVTAAFDTEDPRLLSKNNAQKVAVLTGSNRINDILGYEKLDPNYISLMRIYNQLDTDQQNDLMRYIRGMTDDHSLEVVTA